MNYILFDDLAYRDLLPFTYTRPVSDIRCGIMTMRERWEFLINGSIAWWLNSSMEHVTGTFTADYLQGVFPLNGGDDNLYINGGVFGNAALWEAISSLQPGEGLIKDALLVAMRLPDKDLNHEALLSRSLEMLPQQNLKAYEGEVYSLKKPWDIFSLNDKAIREDFSLITSGRESAPVPEFVMVSGKENLFIEKGAKIYPGCIINASTGPVYIGKDAEILEGTMIRGPFAACEHSVVKMGAKIYGATTIGPGCKVGGEVNNTVFFANSNKGHDGYLGNAVIGEWCNLGADTNCSNLKNNYDEVKVWSIWHDKLAPTGLIFCGLMMGDHSKCGINTMFNTGTVVGVSCNIFGAGFTEKYVPSFSWGGKDGMERYKFDKAMETAGRVMARRGKQLSEAEIEMYLHLFKVKS